MIIFNLRFVLGYLAAEGVKNKGKKRSVKIEIMGIYFQVFSRFDQRLRKFILYIGLIFLPIKENQ